MRRSVRTAHAVVQHCNAGIHITITISRDSSATVPLPRECHTPSKRRTNKRTKRRLSVCPLCLSGTSILCVDEARCFIKIEVGGDKISGSTNKYTKFGQWLGGAVVRAFDLRLEVVGSIPAAALSSATLDKLFTHIVQRLWCYNLMALCKSV